MPNHKTSKNVYLGKEPFGSSADYVCAKSLAIYIYIYVYTHTHTHTHTHTYSRVPDAVSPHLHSPSLHIVRAKFKALTAVLLICQAFLFP
jgi:hypothetical protein